MRARLWRPELVAAALACLSLACALGAYAAQAGAPRVVRTHRDQVAWALDSRGLAYRDIEMTQSFEERGYLYYSAAVHVRLPDGGVAHGWIGCEDGDSQCHLDLRPLGVRGARLPDPAPPAPPPAWVVWADRALREAGELVGSLWRP